MSKILQDISIGENIQKIRRKKGMRQVDVIKKLQVMGSTLSVTHYGHIERGRRNINVSDLIRLQQIFEVDFSEFFKDLIP